MGDNDKKQKLSVFFDLDGVIFKYEKKNYEKPDPKYREEGYFRTRPLDKYVSQLLKTMYESPNMDVYIASSAIIDQEPVEKNEAVKKEKLENIELHMPWFDKSRVIIATEKSKLETVEAFLGRKIGENDILIDDFNKNLIEWEERGGNVVKYINGENTENERFVNLNNGKLIRNDCDDEWCEIIENMIFENALVDFENRLIVTRIDDDNDNYTKYKSFKCGKQYILGLINKEEKMVTPLPDDFEAPYADDELWRIAYDNCVKESDIKEMTEMGNNIYSVHTPCGVGILIVDQFWDYLCDKFECMRLLVTTYEVDGKNAIVVSKIRDVEKINMRDFLRDANREEEERTSYVYVRDIGMLSEKALNEKE